MVSRFKLGGELILYSIIYFQKSQSSITRRSSNRRRLVSRFKLWGELILYSIIYFQKFQSSITRRSANRRGLVSSFKLWSELIPIRSKPQVICHVLQIKNARACSQRCYEINFQPSETKQQAQTNNYKDSS